MTIIQIDYGHAFKSMSNFDFSKYFHRNFISDFYFQTKKKTFSKLIAFEIAKAV